MRKKDFLNPPAEYRVFPILHGLLLSQEDRREAQRCLEEGGCGGAVSNPAWTKEWTKDEANVQKFADAARACTAAGKSMWYYDEVMYPSGWANGRTIEGHPENRGINAAFCCQTVQKGEAYALVLPPQAEEELCAVFAAADGTARELPRASAGKVQGNAPENGTVFLFFLRENNPGHVEGWTKDDLPGGYREHPDFLSPCATDAYIAGALEPVLSRAEKGTVRAVFTDEPALDCFYLINRRNTCSFDSVPWTRGLEKQYEAAYGEPLLPLLPQLFSGKSPAAARTRIRFYSLISQLMAENFTQRVSRWCRQAGTLFSGHFLLEEGLPYHVGYYGDYMKVMSGLDIPGCDLLTGNSAAFFSPGNAWGSNWLFAGKFASSVSRLKGSNTTMIEICPFMDTKPFEQDPFRELMALSTFFAFTGCTHFNSYAYRTLTDNAQMRRWNEYCGRLLAVLRPAKSDCRIGILYPIHDAQAVQANTDLSCTSLAPEPFEKNRAMEKLALAVYASGQDFNILTEPALQQAQAENGGVSIAGLMYDLLLLPDTEWLETETPEALRRFTEAGGTVCCAGRKPCFLTDGSPCPELQLSGLTAEEALTHHGQNMITRARGENILCSAYRRPEGGFSYVVNSGREQAAARIEGEGSRLVLDPETGESRGICLPAEILIPAGRGLFVLEAGEESFFT